MIIYPDQGAGLCNRLHAAANLLAYGAVSGQTILILSLRKYAHYFSGVPRHGFFWYRAPHPRPWRLRMPVCLLRSGRFSQPKLSYTDPEVSRIIDRTSLVLLTGWRFRDLDAMRQQHSLIHRVFMPRPEYGEPIAACITAIRQRCDTLVGVHIRRTDYAAFQEGRFFYADSVYLRWMEAMQRQLRQHVGFLIASDEGVAPSAFPGCDIQVAPGHELQDLYALAACDYLIGPPSTYTSWASLYGQVPLWQGHAADQVPELLDFRIHGHDCNYKMVAMERVKKGLGETVKPGRGDGEW